MKAAVYEGKEQLNVRDVAEPTLEMGEVMIEIEQCCVCGTDMRTYRNGDPRIAEGRILGHEFCGRIVDERQAELNGLAVGDRVVMYIVIPCGECRYCKMGRANLCINRTTMAYHHDGAFARYMKAPAKAVRNGHLFKVESDIPSIQMGLAEPLGCVINAHDRLKVDLYDTVAVIGAGPIGVMHAAVSRLQGAQKVYMMDTMQSRLDIAEGFDFDGTILVEQDGSHIEKVKELTDGFGPDVVIVACSSPYAQADALEMAAKGGRVEYFGGLPKSKPMATLNTNHLHYKEITVTGSYSEKMRDFQAAQALIQSGRFPADKIVTHELPLAEVTKAFDLMQSGEALKVSINPNA